MGSGSSIGRVRGLGSAKEGTHHWWHQRLTAASNLFLMVWLLASLAILPDYSFERLTEWLSSAWAAVPMFLLVASLFYHARLGLQVVIEDYQKDETRVVALILLNAAVFVGGAIALFSIAKIAFTGSAD
ncbi:succinate dehydrogenase, hydrophobic membrane anchor protein [Sphingomonas sp. CJ99]